VEGGYSLSRLLLLDGDVGGLIVSPEQNQQLSQRGDREQRENGQATKQQQNLRRVTGTYRL
jgi:hypothetical protein